MRVGRCEFVLGRIASMINKGSQCKTFWDPEVGLGVSAKQVAIMIDKVGGIQEGRSGIEICHIAKTGSLGNKGSSTDVDVKFCCQCLVFLSIFLGILRRECKDGSSGTQPVRWYSGRTARDAP
ncbi:hypothetical protein SNK04_002326 [Fusarium graminearum]